MIYKLSLLALAGAFGTILRFLINTGVAKLIGISFPLGVLITNITGCFFAGLAYAIFESKLIISDTNKLIILVGFFGAFTTFSTMILDTRNYIDNLEFGFAILNLLLHNILGIIALLLGIYVWKIFT